MPWWLAGILLGAGISTPGISFSANLLDVYRQSLDSDPTFLAARDANRAAQEQRPQALAGLLPNIDVGFTFQGNETTVDEASSIAIGLGRREFHSNQFDITLTQPIYRGDRWVELEQAETRIKQSDYEFASSRQDLMLRVAERYFNVLEAQDELRFARAELDAFGQQLNQAQQRFDVGLIAITDVEEAQAGFDLSRAQVIEAESALDNALEALREVSGEYYDEIAMLSEQVPLIIPKPNDINQWTETALKQNLLLAAARSTSETARKEIDRVNAQHLPTVDFFGSHTRQQANGGISGPSETQSTAFGLQFNLSLVQGGRIISQSRQSRHLYQQTLSDVERQRRSVQRQTRDSFLGVQSGISRVQALEQAVRSTQSAKEAIEAGFQVGTRTSVDVLDAERELFRARRDLAAARYEYILDVLNLKQAAGTLSEDDIVLISSWLTK